MEKTGETPKNQHGVNSAKLVINKIMELLKRQRNANPSMFQEEEMNEIVKSRSIDFVESPKSEMQADLMTEDGESQSSVSPSIEEAATLKTPSNEIVSATRNTPQHEPRISKKQQRRRDRLSDARYLLFFLAALTFLSRRSWKFINYKQDGVKSGDPFDINGLIEILDQPVFVENNNSEKPKEIQIPQEKSDQLSAALGHDPSVTMEPPAVSSLEKIPDDQPNVTHDHEDESSVSMKPPAASPPQENPHDQPSATHGHENTYQIYSPVFANHPAASALQGQPDDKPSVLYGHENYGEYPPVLVDHPAASALQGQPDDQFNFTPGHGNIRPKYPVFMELPSGYPPVERQKREDTSEKPQDEIDLFASYKEFITMTVRLRKEWNETPRHLQEIFVKHFAPPMSAFMDPPLPQLTQQYMDLVRGLPWPQPRDPIGLKQVHQLRHVIGTCISKAAITRLRYLRELNRLCGLSGVGSILLERFPRALPGELKEQTNDLVSFEEFAEMIGDRGVEIPEGFKPEGAIPRSLALRLADAVLIDDFSVLSGRRVLFNFLPVMLLIGEKSPEEPDRFMPMPGNAQEFPLDMLKELINALVERTQMYSAQTVGSWARKWNVNGVVQLLKNMERIEADNVDNELSFKKEFFRPKEGPLDFPDLFELAVFLL